MLMQLSEEDTRSLMEETAPMFTFVMSDRESSKKLINLTLFLSQHKVSVNEPFKVKKELLTKLIGFKPNLQTRGDCLYAVWGLEVEEQKFIIFYSNKGLSIEVVPMISKKGAEKIMTELENKLLGR